MIPRIHQVEDLGVGPACESIVHDRWVILCHEPVEVLGHRNLVDHVQPAESVDISSNNLAESLIDQTRQQLEVA